MLAVIFHKRSFQLKCNGCEDKHLNKWNLLGLFISKGYGMALYTLDMDVALYLLAMKRAFGFITGGIS